MAQNCQEKKYRSDPKLELIGHHDYCEVVGESEFESAMHGWLFIREQWRIPTGMIAGVYRNKSDWYAYKECMLNWTKDSSQTTFKKT